MEHRIHRNQFGWHVLPKRFVKIRHYGFLSTRNKPDLGKHQCQIGVLVQLLESKKIAQSSGVTYSQNNNRCAYCKIGTILRIQSFDANALADLYKRKTDIKAEMKKEAPENSFQRNEQPPHCPMRRKYSHSYKFIAEPVYTEWTSVIVQSLLHQIERNTCPFGITDQCEFLIHQFVIVRYGGL